MVIRMGIDIHLLFTLNPLYHLVLDMGTIITIIQSNDNKRDLRGNLDVLCFF